MTSKECIKTLQNLQEAIEKTIESLSQPEPLQPWEVLAAQAVLQHPELIHCGECKHYVFIDDRKDRFPIRGCSLTGFNDVDADDFCSRAERREVNHESD